MDYCEALEYISSAGDLGIRPGLDNINRLMSAMGEPQKGLNAIHIAGTNGKGSVGAFIAQGLMNKGYSVGRYFSPSVFDIRETVTYNNIPISKEEFASAVTAVRNAALSSNTYPTSFEIETAAAFYHLKSKGCDYTVIETGMGGRSDATNTVEKILAVITPIALDHTAFLGDTIEDIAYEKAGIIKGTAISAPQSPAVAEVLKRSGDIIFAGKAENVTYEYDKTIFDYKEHKGIEIPLLGVEQAENAALASEVIERLAGFSSDDLKGTVWHCRFERLKQEPCVFADGAHNPHGAEALAKNIKLYGGNKKTAFVTGVLKDKDHEKMAEITGPLAQKVYTVTPESPRALSADILRDTYSRYTSAEKADSIEEALKKAMEYEMVVIFGTFTIMKDAYKYLRG